ncbi:class Ib ribonucleoside-diphosphate reductase assembly flavoprotein NrdI [Microbacterium sp. A93]|uniref:class Ib ribonucleoside-diphosphate reductase assembly flavoprotein NrdI n=1 Tax=Microbacterium sp. A93 TaxID=3450716 RepID=UPI003F439CAE
MTSVVSDRRPVDGAEPGAPQRTAARLIYFSSASGYTHRFISKLGYPEGETARLPLITRKPTLLATEPFVLALPTYGGGDGKGAVPKQVIKFLNVKTNRDLVRGVIAAGNTNFYEAYCLGGEIVARKCQVPLMYRFELMGTPEDVTAVREGLERFWG